MKTSLSVVENSVTSNELPEVFYRLGGKGTYLDYIDPSNDVMSGKEIHFAINIDTEFVSHPHHWSEPFQYKNGVIVERSSRQTERLHITTQMRGIHQEKGVIFTSRECADIITRHKVLKTGFDPVDYLIHLGYDAKLERFDRSSVTKSQRLWFDRLPVFRFVLFAHFGTAELMLITRDRYWDDFEELVSIPDPKNPPGKPRLTMKRHLQAVTEEISDEGYLLIKPTIDLDWLLTVNGRKFRVRLQWVDTCALHGIASYKAICECGRVELQYKDNFTSEEKGRMLDMAVERPEDFDNYALGDLYVYDALVGNAENFQKVYRALGIENRYKPPALTIGATVKNLFEAKLCEAIGVSGKEETNFLKDTFLSPVSASALRRNAGLTRALAAKVEGGRCRNNRPTDWRVETPICDIDVSGCYADGLRSQPYPIGNPEILDFEAANRSNYWTLGEFRKVYQKELVPGLWIARVWTSEVLEAPQDFIASWFAPSVGDDLLGMTKYVQMMMNDTERVISDENPEFNLDDGNLKVFTHQIINGVITHDFLEWLDEVATPKQRKELESKLLVKVAVIYPKSWEIKAPSLPEQYAALVEQYKAHSDKDTVQRVANKGRKKLRREDGQYHGWFSINIGELIMDELLTWRKFYQKTEGKKSPMDLVFKLCCNTLYGDMTSKYFDSANTIVGNNVTFRARLMVWCLEKALHSLQSITDGGCVDLNRVLYPLTDKNRVTGENVVDLYRLDDREAARLKKLRFAPLGGCDRIDLVWEDKEQSLVLHKDGVGKKLTGKDAENWVNQTALEHVQNIFPNLSVLHAPSKKLDAVLGEDGLPKRVYTDRKGLFSFEMKAFFDSGVFHGSANYLLQSPVGDVLKMRSYETAKPHESIDGAVAVDVETKEMELSPHLIDRYGCDNNPAKDFMYGLLSGEPLARQVSFVKDGIVKPGDYKHQRTKYRRLGLVPGDGLYKAGLLREFSLSQFTFKTMNQFIEWEKRITRLKEKFGQSVERYFLNDDGRLDFGLMVDTIDALIKEGVENPIDSLNEKFGNPTDMKIHPAMGTYTSVKALLGLSEE